MPGSPTAGVILPCLLYGPLLNSLKRFQVFFFWYIYSRDYLSAKFVFVIAGFLHNALSYLSPKFAFIVAEFSAQCSLLFICRVRLNRGGISAQCSILFICKAGFWDPDWNTKQRSEVQLSQRLTFLSIMQVQLMSLIEHHRTMLSRDP